MKKLLLLIFLLINIKSNAQNTPYLWRHDFFVDDGLFVLIDDNQNTYSLCSSNSGGTIPVINKITASGTVKFSNSYLPSGYQYMSFRNAFYKDAYIYVASEINTGIAASERVYLLKIDTLGNIVRSWTSPTDTTQGIITSGLLSYNYGFSISNTNNIYFAYQRQLDPLNYQYNIMRCDTAFQNFMNYSETMLWGEAGPFNASENDEVYYAKKGEVKKLNSALTAVAYSTLLNGAATIHVNQIVTDTSGNLWIAHENISSSFSRFYTTRFTDTGSMLNGQVPVYLISRSSSSSVPYFNRIKYIEADSSLWFIGGPHYTKYFEAFTGSLVYKDTITPGNMNDVIYDTHSNEAYVTGFETSSSQDYFTVKAINKFGFVTRKIIMKEGFQQDNRAETAVFDSAGKMIVIGTFFGGSGDAMITVKYDIPSIVTSVNEIMTNGLNVYPVPAKDKIFFKNMENVYRASVSSLNGRMYDIDVNFDNSLDISKLNPGVYILQLENDQMLMETKIMIN